MKITNINFLPLAKIKNQNRLNFCAGKPLLKDTFEKSAKAEKTVTISDIDGNDITAVIREEDYKDGSSNHYGTNPKMLSLSVDGKKIGHAIIYDSKERDALYIKDLQTEENSERHYRGAGTELLKCLIEESKKCGHKGKIKLTAAHFPPPFVFYYKNNFNTLHRLSKQQAAIDYAARNNIPFTNLLRENTIALEMQLDEEGAEALLAGERLYEKKLSYSIAKTKINDEEFEANYTEIENGNFYLQIINKDANTEQQVWFATGNIEQDIHGNKVLQLYSSYTNSYAPDEVQAFAQNSIEILSDILEAKSFRICEFE